MTVSSQTASIVATGDGVNTAFTYDFEVPYQADGSTPAVAAFTTNTGGTQVVLTLGTDFSISGVGNELGGSVTYPLAGDPLPSGNTITIYRALEYVQDTVLEDQGFRASSAEHMGDTLEMQIQQIVGDLAGTVRGQPGEVLGRLPSAEARALQTILFDADGNPGVTPLTILVATGATSFGTLALAQAATIPAAATFVILMGYYAVGDTVASVYIKATAGAGAGKFQSADGQWWIITGRIFDPRQFGAKGDDSTNDRTAFNNAQGFGPLMVTPGTYRFASSLTFSAAVQCTSGAILRPANATTLTFNGGFEADVTQCFANATAGLGAVAFDPKKTSTGLPEWWGALPVDWSAAPTPPSVGPDCLPGLIACMAALEVTQLQPALYFTTARWNLNTSDRTVRGTGLPSETFGSAIVVGSGSLDVMYVGSASDPGSINAMARNIQVENVLLARYAPVVPPAGGSESSAACGLKVRYALDCQFTQVRCGGSYGHSIGTFVQNSVGCRFDRVKSFRSTAGTSATNDIMWALGLFGDGPYSIESCNFWDCAGELGYTPTAGKSRGISVLVEFTDVDILRPEFNVFDYGYYIDCAGANRGLCVDNFIRDGRFDQMKVGCVIQNCPSLSVINIDAFHSMQTGGAAGAATILVNSNGGIVNLSDTCSCFNNGNTAIGLSIVAGAGNLVSRVDDRGCVYNNYARPIVIATSQSCRLTPVVHQIDQAVTTAVIDCVGLTRSIIAPLVFTDTISLAPIGIKMNSACQYNEVNCSGLDPTILPAGASATKLVYNGGNITAVGAFGTGNLASGIMA